MTSKTIKLKLHSYSDKLDAVKPRCTCHLAMPSTGKQTQRKVPVQEVPVLGPALSQRWLQHLAGALMHVSCSQSCSGLRIHAHMHKSDIINMDIINPKDTSMSLGSGWIKVIINYN